MTGAQCAITSNFTSPAISTIKTAMAKNFIKASSSTYRQFPTNLTKRKNHLLPKIIKTLTEPKITKTVPFLPNESIIPTDSDETFNKCVTFTRFEDISVESEPVRDEEAEKSVEAYESSGNIVSVAGVSEVSVAKFDKSLILKVGMYFVGLFVFQTVCAVCMLGSADTHKKYENLETKVSFKGKSVLKLNGVGNLDELELQRKIGEIRAMARDARIQEQRERRNSGLIPNISDDGGGDDDDVNESARVKVRSGIEKEVDAKLVKLQRNLNSAQEKSLGLPVGSLSLSEVEDRINKGGSLDANKLNATMLFEKKPKFRSQVTKLMKNNPKGFQGFGDRKGVDKKKGQSSAIDVMAESGSIDRNGFKLSEHGKELDSLDSSDTSKKGLIQGKNHGTNGANLSRESNGLETHNSSSFRKDNEAVLASSNKRKVLGRYGSSKSGDAKNKSVHSNVKYEQSETNNNLWWLKLPYVLAILMRRSSDSEGPGGLYTLKSTSRTPNRSGLAYTVAFEDRGDANNFCCLLESFFDDLGDFRADIVPLLTNDLQEEMKSPTMKLIVVKKGQLKLYAGQPIADVERDLRSLAQ